MWAGRKARAGAGATGGAATGGPRGGGGAAVAAAPKDRKAGRAAKKAARAERGARRFLVRPDTDGPRVRVGLAWFAVAMVAVALGRFAVAAVWAPLAAVAAFQVTRAWDDAPREVPLPRWSAVAAGVAAAVPVLAASIGTALAGIALAAGAVALVVAHLVAEGSADRAGAAAIGAVMAAVPALSVVLVVRAGVWAGLFLVLAVSFYDAGCYIGAAESSSRIEGPVTGAIGILAVTFGASAVGAEPFDRVSAWFAGALMVLACPLGQMLVSAQLPAPGARVPAMRRLDSWLLSAPLMLAATWALG